MPLRVLITGGTGSLGRSLTRFLTEAGYEVIVYSRDEGKHAKYFSGAPGITCAIGDVRDRERLSFVVRQHEPWAILHTAALKRINDIEYNIDECIKTNVLGSENVASVALQHSVKKCVLVSTDKACLPINAYGAAKFLAEKTFINFDRQSKSTIFSIVRYGNVIASRGSFIPLWIDKMRSGAPIDVTSMDCTRFLFTLDSAVNLVLAAMKSNYGGEIFVPKIESFSMMSVILALESILGVRHSAEKINVVGLRPGEKIHEDMLSEHELPHTFEHFDGDKVVIMPQLKCLRERVHPPTYKKYTGPQLNSELCLNLDVDELVPLIKKGLEATDNGD